MRTLKTLINQNWSDWIIYWWNVQILQIDYTWSDKFLARTKHPISRNIHSKWQPSQEEFLSLQMLWMARFYTSLRTFYCRYWDLIKHYEVSSQILHAIFRHDHIQWHPQSIRYFTNFWTYYRTGRYYRFWPYYQISGGFHRTLQWVRIANRGRLLLRTPGPVPFAISYLSSMLYVYRFLWPLRLGWLLVWCLYKEVYLQIFKRVSFWLHGCCGEWEGWARKPG